MDLGETERADILDHMKSRMEGSRLQQPRNERSSSLWIHRLQLRDLSLENNNDKRVFYHYTFSIHVNIMKGEALSAAKIHLITY